MWPSMLANDRGYRSRLQMVLYAAAKLACRWAGIDLQTSPTRGAITSMAMVMMTIQQMLIMVPGSSIS